MKYFLFLLLPLVGCGIQNSSLLTQEYRADTLSFSDIREGSLVFRGLEKEKVADLGFGLDDLSFSEVRAGRLVVEGMTRVDRGVGLEGVLGFGIDSLNALFFLELQKQFADRGQPVPVSSSPPSPIQNGHEIRLTGLRISPKYGAREFGRTPTLEKAVLVVEAEFFDLGRSAVVSRVVTGAEIIAGSYSKPWVHAIRLTVTRMTDYVASGGAEYERPQ